MARFPAHPLFARRAAAVFLALALAACGGSVELLGNLHEAEANEVVAALAEAGITARKQPGKDGAVNVAVGQSDIAKSLSVLRDAALPRERRATMGDVFRKEGLISSPLEERARYLWALSQELSETISQVDGVLKARVHVVLPERGVGGEPPMPSSAAVFVKHRRSHNMDSVVPEMRRLVASSIPGLAAEKVTVVLVPAAPKSSEPGGPDTATATATAAARRDGAASPAVSPRVVAAGGGAAALLAMAASIGWWLLRSRRARAAIAPGRDAQA